MKKKWKIVMIILIIVIVLIIIAGLAAGNYFYNLALNPHSDKSAVLEAPHNELSIPEETKDDGTSVELTSKEWFKQIEPSDIYMQSYDALKLHAYQISSNTRSDKWIIICHGYNGAAYQMSKSARQFHDMGFNVLMPDCRGHGDSEGDYIGMGWHDRLDITDWIDKLINEHGDIEIVLYGVSMGGATVMMTSGEKLPSNVKAIVEDCGYTSVHDEFAYQLKGIFNLPAFPVMNFASLVTKFKAGYSLTEASAVRQVAKSQTPILFIHGTEDTFVPASMLDEVYEAARCEKEKYVVAGAGHGEASETAGQEYWDVVETFIGKYILLNQN